VRIVETRIAEQVGTSRGPVRDALALLERDGLVTKLPNRGACVVDVSEQRLREAASLRALLEEFAVAQAVQRLTTEDLAELGSLIQRMETAACLRAREKFNELDFLLAEQKPGGGGTRVKGPRRRRTTLWRGFRPWSFLCKTTFFCSPIASGRAMSPSWRSA
jgi:hypothetical protein